jgi:hypothetical protein
MRVAAAHTIPRELRAVKAYGFDPERFRDLGVPTLLLSGGTSPAVSNASRRDSKLISLTSNTVNTTVATTAQHVKHCPPHRVA